MVRNLYLNFLFNKEGTRIVPESESVCLAAALASAESRKVQTARIVGLSSVSFPFWIVQTSTATGDWISFAPSKADPSAF